MKKILLAGTAMAGASLIATSAMAELTISAFGNVNYIAETNESKNAAGDELGTDDKIGTDFEITISGSKDIDLGTVGFYVEMEAIADGGGANDNVDEANISLSADWGQLMLGQNDGAQGAFGKSGLSASGSADGWLGDVHMFDDGIADNDDTAKVMYTTPSIGGFQAAASFSPNESDGDTFKNGLELGVGYSADMGGASVALGAGYSQMDAATATNGDVDGYHVGASVTMSGFSVGAGYMVVETDNTSAAGDLTGSKAKAWNVGVGYTMGSTSFGVGYESMEDDENDNTVFNTEGNSLYASVSHTLGEGVSVTLGAHTGEMDDTNPAAAVDNGYDFSGVGVELKTSW